MASMLHEIVHKLLAEDRLAAPEAVAREALALLPEGELRAALGETLPGWVRVQVGQQRLALARTPREASPGDQPLSDTQGSSVAGGQEPNTDPDYSVWTTRIQSWTDELRNGRVSVGPGALDWKFFRDLNREDCQYNQDESLKLAAANQAKAEKWQRTERAMREHEVDRAGDLPDEVLSDIWQ